MPYSFVEFAEMVERRLSASWRSVVVMHDDELLEGITSTVFTMDGSGRRWKFSFALRCDGVWYQAKREIEPFDYDAAEPPDIRDVDANKSPENRASEVSTGMLSDVRDKIAAERG